jgi:hypothetical protein
MSEITFFGTEQKLEKGDIQMATGLTEKESRELAEKRAAREVKQPYSTEVEDHEIEKAQKERPAPPPAAKRDT